MEQKDAAQITVDKTTRIIDLKIPLPYLISALVGLSWALVSMYFQIGQLVRSVDELQITVKSGNTSLSGLSGDMALLKFRVSANEDTLKRHGDSIKFLEDRTDNRQGKR